MKWKCTSTFNVRFKCDKLVPRSCALVHVWQLCTARCTAPEQTHKIWGSLRISIAVIDIQQTAGDNVASSHRRCWDVISPGSDNRRGGTGWWGLHEPLNACLSSLWLPPAVFYPLTPSPFSFWIFKLSLYLSLTYFHSLPLWNMMQQMSLHYATFNKPTTLSRSSPSDLQLSSFA